MAENLKPRSGVITDGPDRAPTRAMLKAAGFSDDDLRRPIVGVANTWIEIGPCNFHLRRLAAKVGCFAAFQTFAMLLSILALGTVEAMYSYHWLASLVVAGPIAAGWTLYYGHWIGRLGRQLADVD